MRKKNMVKFEWDDLHHGALIISAIRYCLGRATYMPSLVQEATIEFLPYLSLNDLKVISSDIRKCDNYGMKEDEDSWVLFLSAVESEIDKRKGG